MPTPPTDGSVLFLIAEQVRPETGGKLSIIGFYAGGDILVPENTTQTVLSSLAFIFIFKDGEGQFKTRLTIMSPSGKQLADIELRETTFVGKSHSIVTQLAPFVTTEYGRYEVLLKLNEHVYARSFSLNRSPTVSPLS